MRFHRNLLVGVSIVLSLWGCKQKDSDLASLSLSPEKVARPACEKLQGSGLGTRSVVSVGTVSYIFFYEQSKVKHFQQYRDAAWTDDDLKWFARICDLPIVSSQYSLKTPYHVDFRELARREFWKKLTSTDSDAQVAGALSRVMAADEILRSSQKISMLEDVQLESTKWRPSEALPLAVPVSGVAGLLVIGGLTALSLPLSFPVVTGSIVVSWVGTVTYLSMAVIDPDPKSGESRVITTQKNLASRIELEKKAQAKYNLLASELNGLLIKNPSPEFRRKLIWAYQELSLIDGRGFSIPNPDVNGFAPSLNIIGMILRDYQEPNELH